MKEFFKQWGGAIQLGWNVITISAFLFLLIWLASYLSTFSHDVAESLDTCDAKACKSADSFAIAAELGRLDIVSISLTIFSVVVAFVAVFAFLHIREKAVVISQEIAAEVSKKFAEQVADEVTKKVATEIAKVESEKAAKIHTADYLEGPSFKKALEANITIQLDTMLPNYFERVSLYYDNEDSDADDFSRSMRGE
jgi:ribosomal protein L31E